MNPKRIRTGAIYVLLLIALGAFLYTSFARSPGGAATVIPIAKAADMVRKGEVASISIKDDRITLVRKGSNELLQSRIETDAGLVETLRNLGVTPTELQAVDISVEAPRLWESWGGVLLALLPLLLLGLFFFFIMRQAQGAGNQAFSFGKSRARMFTGDRPTVTFDDVAGNEEAKQELQEVVEFLKEPEKFASLGARIPKGVLLVGPPGTGKTLMAKAVSGEAGVPFFSISGSEFVEMFVGVGASRVRDLFEQAKKNSPCIIFIDEIDAVGRHRGAGMGGSHDEREQTLNQILVEMDGFDTDTNVILIAATNRPDILDPALLRPGRFDRRVTMDAPDVKGRREILDVHVRGKPLAADVDLDVIAKQTPGFAGADLENLVNEAAILAARRNRRSIGMAELQEAIERVIAGPERRSRLITPREKEVVAFHEAGHAVAMHFLPNHDPVHKVTIVPRGMAGGYTLSLPNEETRLVTKEKFQEQLVALLGGRVAEELRFKDVTTGASNDLERVTAMARAMVTQWGMSPKLGPIRYGEREELVFLGREISERRNYSDRVAQAIDEEVRRFVEEAHTRCRQLLSAHWDKVELVAQCLLDVETIDAAEFEALMRGENPFAEAEQNRGKSVAPAGSRSGEASVGSDKRSDSGVDIGGTLPAPA
ncbi:ATP-dependent zinc metalloprotease FtsH [Litorilinea aerophila]|uniref:ATP-dependent zinc metalloprotease FtsH n=1 Tax=Litorilinea aerophila TaxID=1204385 RepID=A0A540VK37_9CHLR|nr:ATP-dependent zinc metalloprotease FtsH [Litorilinea aerophila]MCC9075210.1 ATP-dependent zinc metalloprotease FtsH [Litorilinea aerophila]OUC08168.1 cell division protein FtsH [Litorilinea aerophila]GIV78354.1 MAG: ATP-dependent zinc metalloprotease FtsH [Litorilinea sp.]